MTVKDNITQIRERILRVCSRTNRNPEEITIVAVSKGRTVQQIQEVIEAGITDIGENKVGEALSKHHGSWTMDRGLIKWHLVGHLQTNKVKDAVKIFDLIHSVDSLHLAVEIDKQAAKINKAQDILLQIKISEEATKFGLEPEKTVEVISEIAKCKNLNFKGLMTIAPLVDNPEKARPYFRRLKELKDQINTLSTIDYRLSTLSMGMTDDFVVAIEEGSTMLRLGRAVFD
jgi:hypothetical protein